MSNFYIILFSFVYHSVPYPIMPSQTMLVSKWVSGNLHHELFMDSEEEDFEFLKSTMKLGLHLILIVWILDTAGFEHRNLCRENILLNVQARWQWNAVMINFATMNYRDEGALQTQQ